MEILSGGIVAENLMKFEQFLGKIAENSLRF